MKRLVGLFMLVSTICFSSAAFADFVSGSTGADGAFSPTANTTVQLPPSGILNYTTVNIPSGVTVTFTKNATNTPVYMLATGTVTIAGTIKVDGGSVAYSNPVSTTPGAGGSGGFAGGYGGVANTLGGKGMGPGGGSPGPNSTYTLGGGGGFATAGGTYSANYGAGGPAYGNARLVPFIGGSGGGGGSGSTSSASYGGGGGGGAILIASSTTITISGTISANGGDSYSSTGGGGSGGAIKLIANGITGSGTLSAKGGSLNQNNRGGQGRIRLEATTNTFSAGTDPPYTYGLPIAAFPANMPTLSLTSIGGAAVPASPGGAYNQPDILLPSSTVNPVTVNITAANIPTGTTVVVTVTPQIGASSSVNATLSGTDAASTASASVSLSTQYANVITAQATFTLLASLNFEGESIERVRVASTLGKNPETVYISRSGKEIPAERLIVAGLVK